MPSLTANSLTKQQRIGQISLYLLSLLFMFVSGYNHLDFAAGGIRNLRISDVIVAWPVMLLMLAGPLLLSSIMIAIIEPYGAARLARIAAMIGLSYYIVTGCLLASWVSVFVFMSPRGLLFFIVPAVSLIWVLIHARQMAQRYKEQQVS